MNDLGINIAIHEIMGYKQVTPKEFRGKKWTKIAFEKDGAYYGGWPPRYTEDLNLIAQVEQTITDPQIRFVYEATVHQLNTKYGLGVSVWETMHASAKQRAEALVKTLVRKTS